ncbi:MAG: hypothetical protein Q9197_001343 [Variospora fuerteventurae]
MARGNQATRTLRKNNPFSGGRSGENAPGKQRLKSVDPSRTKDAPRVSVGSSLNQASLSRSVSLNPRTEHSTFYNDPVSVRQWAAETAPNTPVDFTEYGFPEPAYGLDALRVCETSQAPGSFPLACSSASHVSFPVPIGFPGDDFSAACAYSDPNGMVRSLGDLSRMKTHNASDATGNYEPWSYPTPTAADMQYSTSNLSHLPYNGDSSIEPRFSDWSTGFYLPDTEASRDDYPGGPNSLAWSPLLAADPSVSSSYSRSSYLAIQTNTPLSPVAQESDWPVDPITCPEESSFYPAFSLGEPSELAGYPTGHQDPMSTLRPSRPFQRNPISGMDLWTQGDAQSQAHPGPAVVDLTHTRRSSDVEATTTAREHPLYQVGPKEDGFKHLDSHLKPYRCKLSTCSTLAFSSTACLLRHEREAHGMHGHGDKPHLCTYQDCERAIVGNGFPRRWNLYDHMRRVHGYTGSASSPGSTSPTPSSASSFSQGQATLAIRKRRTSSPPKAEALKKTKSNNSGKPVVSAVPQGRQRPSMQMIFQQHKAAINARMAALDPTDALGMEQIHADCAILRTMAMNIQSQNTSQLAN